MNQFIHQPGKIFLEREGKVIAEITYSETEPGVCTIDHTFVDDSLRGQGIASQLVQLAVDDIRTSGRAVNATCSYAAAWLTRHPLQ
ncbi:MAG: N-acetyltransferase [Bacteroidales bacterium]|nr:N-acetyltransferase [Bacteroidales bacterium]